MTASTTSSGEVALATMIRLARLSKLNDMILHDVARDHGLTAAEQTVLTTLRWMGPPFRQTPTDLAAALLQTSGGVTATLHRLEAAELVSRIPDPSDKRRLLVELTDKGKAVQQQVFNELKQKLDRVVSTIDGADLAAAERGIEVLLVAVESAMQHRLG